MKKIVSSIVLFCILQLNFVAFAKDFEDYIKYPSFSNLFLGEDKYERTNRKFYDFNLKMNQIFVKKIHILWATLVPKVLIDSINYAYINIEYPKRAISCILQKDFDGLGHETKRFFINTTFGVAGLLDIANKMFKLEPYSEDMEQALAKCKVGCGKYLVLPFISSTTSRDIYGRILDFALTPTTYIMTPVAAAVKMALLINRTTKIQPFIKLMQTNFADSYEINKIYYGIDKYIKLSNYDRKNVLDKIDNNFDEIDLVNIPKENLNVKGRLNDSSNLYVNTEINDELKPDIYLDNYNAQSPILDSIRTVLFDINSKNNTFWSELSFFNRNFEKKLKTDEVEIMHGMVKYPFKYRLQKNKSAPLAIIFPSIGENEQNSHNINFAQLFYNEGYSVLLLGSHFHWQFINCISANYAIGNIQEDIKYISKLVNDSINLISKKHNRVFTKRTAFGTSLGAYVVLYLANKQYSDNAGNIDKFIAICPPYDLIYATKQLDKVISSWKLHTDNLENIVASTFAKVLKIYQNSENMKNSFSKLPFSNFEAKLISAFIFHQKLSNLIYGYEIKKNPNVNKTELHNAIYKMNYQDYINKYLLVNNTYEDLRKMVSFDTISNYLINKDNYKIFHSVNDYLISENQLKTLKKLCEDKLVLFDNGAHLGFIYRNEFLNALKKEIRLN